MNKALESKVLDLIELLVSRRPERYPRERIVALSSFATWLNWPHDDEIFEHASTVALANAYTHFDDLKRSPPDDLTIDRLATALANPAIDGLYHFQFELHQPDLSALTDIISFFMHSSPGEVVSLNRAFHFVGRHGFVDPNQEPCDLAEVKKLVRGTTMLKALWKDYRIVGPLAWAAEYELYDLINMAPDFDEMTSNALPITTTQSALNNYFGAAKFCTDKLKQLGFDGFFELPSYIAPYDPNLGTFDSEQLSITAEYAAPETQRRARKRRLRK